MQMLSAAEMTEALPWPARVDAIRQAFVEGVAQPLRTHFHIDTGPR